MASLSTGHFSTASKRSRSQQSSPAPLESPPAPKATKTEYVENVTHIPAFLRQSKADVNAKFRELNWQERLRIVQGKSDPESKWVQDSSPQVLQRNRYFGVQPWDKSRIHLKVAEGDSDYINASPITLQDPQTEVETKYIASQGPKENVLSHFWQMIRDETGDVAVIVMLTPTEESGREKCYQYFPLDAHPIVFKVESKDLENGTAEGEVTYVETASDTGPNTIARKLHLTFGSETKIVWHLLFTAFPDFGVPEDQDRAELLELIKLSEQKNPSPGNPRIIHCSAGVGRSGTFIALDFLLSQLESGAVKDARADEDIVQNVVHRLREQRMMMVQMENQFQFLYDILREEFEKKVQTVEAISGLPSPKFWGNAVAIETSPDRDTVKIEAGQGLQGKEYMPIGEVDKVKEANPEFSIDAPNNETS